MQPAKKLLTNLPQIPHVRGSACNAGYRNNMWKARNTKRIMIYMRGFLISKAFLIFSQLLTKWNAEFGSAEHLYEVSLT